MSKTARGERQQVEYLRAAKEKIESALECQQAGMRDPALADADTAAGHLESYRKGPKKMKNAVGGEDDAE